MPSQSYSHVEWRVIPRFPFYEVSNSGEIRRCVPGRNGSPIGKNLRKRFDPDGRYCVEISINGKRYLLRVHRAVAEAFIGPCPSERQVNHIDGDFLNNCQDNLEYVTQKENLDHATRLGLKAKGEANGSARLTVDVVLMIRDMASKGIQQKKIARALDLTPNNVHDVVRRNTWNHI